MNNLMPRWCQPPIMFACMAVILILSICTRSVMLFKTGLIVPFGFFIGLLFQVAIQVSTKEGRPEGSSPWLPVVIAFFALLPVPIVVFLWIHLPTPWGR